MHKSMWYVPIAALAILSPGVVKAADITYSVNQSVGSSGSVTGSITTDGNSGILGTADILNWNLVINDGTNPWFDLNGMTNSEVGVLGSDLSATATQLLFDFGGADGGYFLFENLTIGDGGPFACFEADTACSGAPAGTSLATEDGEGDIVYTSMDGVGVIGTAGVAPTPEPESLFLLGSGLLGVVGMARRRIAA